MDQRYNNKFNFKHGHRTRLSGTSGTYRSWMAMKQRCLKPNPRQERYRGLLCRRWYRFENFLADMGERPVDKKTIERIDNRKGYTPSNCRWATYREQVRNSPSTKLTFDDAVQIHVRRARGEKASALAVHYGISLANVYYILSGKSWPDAQAEATKSIYYQ